MKNRIWPLALLSINTVRGFQTVPCVDTASYREICDEAACERNDLKCAKTCKFCGDSRYSQESFRFFCSKYLFKINIKFFLEYLINRLYKKGHLKKLHSTFMVFQKTRHAAAMSSLRWAAIITA